MKKKKIAIVVNSLAKGGAERSNAMISKIIEYLGHFVTIIAVNDFVDFEYGGDYICLGNQKTTNIFVRKWSKLTHAHQIFKTSNFDVVIDARSRPSFFKTLVYRKIIFRKTPTVSIIHNSDMQKSFPKKKYLAEYLYKKDHLITVSEKIKEIINYNYNFNQVRTINNAISKEELERLSKKEIDNLSCNKFILFFGRFENKSKNLFFLLKAYAQSILLNEGVKLVLLGKGPDKLILENEIRNLKLTDHVIFKDYTPNPMPYVKKALFTVMTSHYEGFPMTIIESLSIGTPLVTLDFVSGPSEVIVTGKNGILVKEKSIENFTLALNKMINDTEFYNGCKKHCKDSVQRFEMHEIAKEWNKLLQQL